MRSLIEKVKVDVLVFTFKLVILAFANFFKNTPTLNKFKNLCSFFNVPFLLSTEEGHVLLSNQYYKQAFLHDTLSENGSQINVEKILGLNLRKRKLVKLVNSEGEPKIIPVELFGIEINKIACVAVIIKSQKEFLNFDQLNESINFKPEIFELLSKKFDYIISFDSDYKYRFISKNLVKLLGYEIDDVYNQPISILLEDSNKKLVSNLISDALHTINKEINYTIALKNKEGNKTVFLKICAKVFLDKNNEFAGCVCIANDITEKTSTALTESMKIALLDSVISSLVDMLGHGENAMKTAENFDESLTTLLRNMTEILGVSRICLAKVEQEQEDLDSFVLLKKYEKLSRCTRRCAFCAAEPIKYAQVISDASLALLQDDKIVQSSSSSSEVLRSFMKEWGIRSLIYIPIFVNKEFWGFFTVQDDINNKHWEAAEIATLRLIAVCIGSVISMQQKVEYSAEINEYLGKAIEIIKDNALKKVEILAEGNKQLSNKLKAQANV